MALKKRIPAPAFALALLALLVTIIFAASAVLMADDATTMTVKPGQSLSFLCFKVYSRYDKNIERIVLKANPQMSNPDQLKSGQKIKFPRLAAKDKTKSAGDDGQLAPSNAYITYLDGQGQVKSKECAEWNKAKINQELNQGDIVKTNDGTRAEIMTNDGDVIRLAENTRMEINKLEGNPPQKVKKSGFFLSLGRMWNRAKSLASPESEYIVRTPTAISGVRGTSFAVAVGAEQDTNLKIYSGVVQVWNPQMAEGKPSGAFKEPVRVQGPQRVSMEQWTEIVLKQYQHLRVTSKGIESQDTFDPAKEKDDPWAAWNMQRDSDLAQP